jgi:hypothetical protein
MGNSPCNVACEHCTRDGTVRSFHSTPLVPRHAIHAPGIVHRKPCRTGKTALSSAADLAATRPSMSTDFPQSFLALCAIEAFSQHGDV